MLNIALIISLILLNGIFSMSEIAMVSARKFKLETAARGGSWRAKRALELSDTPNRFLSTIQIGITLIGIATGILSAESLAGKLSEVIASSSYFLSPYSHSISIVLIVIIITFFSIVFGELLPKRIGLLFPEKIASAVAAPMDILSRAASPFIWLLGKTNDFFLKILGIESEPR